ncbi:MAG: TIGR00366 family protein, partial [Flavobacteriales bacterium]|nr:TIGR00366 family protein [Flavobacteriales bacterium]
MPKGKSEFSSRFIHVFRTLLPSPFAIAIVLTIATALLALLFGTFPDDSSKLKQLALWWEKGLWDKGLMVFALQAMIMLVLGHVLALTKPVAKLIDKVTKRFCNSTSSAAYTVTLLTVLAGLFNWGVGLIFGAIFARKVAEYAARSSIKLNYALIGAAGYSGLMVWH